MAGSQISTSVTIINSLLGYQAVSLTNMGASAESLIAAGSKVEVASAFFTFSGDETPNWTACGTGNTCYITVIPAGTAGSQTITAEYTDTAPTWSDSKQGYYASAASTTRYVGGVTKGGAASYQNAFIIEPTQSAQTFMGSVTVDDNLVVSGAMTLAGTLTAESTITLSQDTGAYLYGPQYTYKLDDSNLAHDTIHAYVSTWLATGQTCMMSGVWAGDNSGTSGTEVITLYAAERASSETIVLYGVNQAGNPRTVNCDNGSATAHPGGMAW